MHESVYDGKLPMEKAAPPDARLSTTSRGAELRAIASFVPSGLMARRDPAAVYAHPESETFDPVCMSRTAK